MKKENLNSEKNQELKSRALDYIMKYIGDGQMMRISRQDALKAYRREPYKEDSAIAEGSRSKFVMSDLADTIEWIMPSLMRIFYSGQEVVKIEGHGPEDEAGAELLNEKVNWDFTRQNNGFIILHDAFKSALLDRVAVIKYWWEKKDIYESMEFNGLSDTAYGTVSEDPDFIVDNHEQTQDENENPPEMAGTIMPTEATTTHNIKGRRIKERIRRPVAAVVPGEEFIGSLLARNFKEEEFVGHRKRMHKFDLMREYGIDEDDLTGPDILFGSTDVEIFERFKDLGGNGFFQDQEEPDFYYVYECCMNEDQGEQRQPIILTLLGNLVIRKEDNSYGHPNYCTLSPIRMPHRAIGMSFYDLLGDLQKLRSALARFMLNNIYYQTEAMLIVNPWKINVADFLTQRHPGGIVRTKTESVNLPEAVWPVPVQPLSGNAFSLLETAEGWKENRTGVTRYNQGIDANSLNKTARGISEIMSASQQRIEMVARVFAETGVKDLMTAFAQMNIDYLDEPTNIRLNQEWKQIDPKTIDIKFDVTVDVALGTGGREMKVQQLMSLEDRSKDQVMIQGGIITQKNLYEMRKATLKEMGFKNVEKFVTEPPPPQPPQSPSQPGMQQLGPGGPGANGPNGSAQGPAGIPPSGIPAGFAMGAGSQTPVG